MNKLNVAFLWHMHQPYYKDDTGGMYMMPWVRLHGVKDYYPMARLIERFDNVKATFNFVPVLVEQINDYVENGARDTLMDLTVKRPSGMDLSEKCEALESFFRVNYKRFIEPNRRYFDLLVKRGVHPSAAEVKGAARAFSDNDLTDLQVLFNLSWFHSLSIDEDANLKELKEKGRDFSEADKAYVLKRQGAILSEVIPLYKRLKDLGKIELSCSPYYHPILPLLCDTDIARASSPGIPLPSRRFSYPDDARRQIEYAIRYHGEQFASPPSGMWPSEGSVSDMALDLLADSGIQWIATDEDILFNTLAYSGKKRSKKHVPDRRSLYLPYRYKKGSRSVEMIFRDKNLSNLISFNYNSWEPRAAAEDLLGHFLKIREDFPSKAGNRLVTIAMDGENAWEYYKDNGREFFETLYSKLDRHEAVRTSTISGFLERERPEKVFKRVFPGSWINHNFEVWIGNRQKNLAWEYLGMAREELSRSAENKVPASKNAAQASSGIKNALREILIAEGSDWNWWHSFESDTKGRGSFAYLFRKHLKNVYKELKIPVPGYLKKNIA
ncbi:glycoside hydrolase family 57 protein [Candidatus Omnitrophota bacterium]